MNAVDARRDVHSVLVIEDEPDHQMIARVALEDAGYQVWVSPLLHDALDLLSTPGIGLDAVVLDLDLPDHHHGSSLELVRAVSPVPIVVRTCAPADVRRQLSGASSCVAKSDPIEALVAAVNDAMARRPERQAAPPLVRDVSTGTDGRLLLETVVRDLRRWSGLETWLVSRIVGDDWGVLAVAGEGFDLGRVGPMPLDSTLCGRMIKGHLPRVVPDVARDRVGRDAPFTTRFGVGAYVGIPIVIDGDGIFGTLVGLDPRPHTDPTELLRSRPAFELLSRTLAAGLGMEIERIRMRRRLQAVQASSLVDEVTQLGNAVAFEQTLRAEDARCARLGHVAALVAVDVSSDDPSTPFDGVVGDVLLRRASVALQRVLRASDQAYRVSETEIVVLLPESDGRDARTVAGRLDRQLRLAGVDASIRTAVRDADRSLEQAGAGIVRMPAVQ